MTPKQQRTLEFVRGYFVEHGRGPTVRRICEEFGLKSTSMIGCQLQALTEYGFLRRTGESSGNYVPVEADRLGLHRIPTADLLAELERRTEGGAAK